MYRNDSSNGTRCSMAMTKRKKGVSTIVLSLKKLRAEGFVGDKVEQKLPYSFISRDYINCIDIIVFHPEKMITVGVQATTDRHIAPHVEKCLAIPQLLDWLRSGNKFEIWGWGKRTPKGEKAYYKLTVKELTVEDFPK